MATIQFPDPTNLPDGYTFEAENGVTYTLDKSGGGGWTAYSSEGFDDRYVEVSGDTMTGDLTVPNLVATGDVSADNGVFAGDIQASSFNGGQLAGFRNQLINGGFDVWQRGTTGFTSAGFTADRWYASAGGVEFGPFAGQTGPLQTSGFLGAGSNAVQITQPIELDEPGAASPYGESGNWTVSWWAREGQSVTLQSVEFAKTGGSASVPLTSNYGTPLKLATITVVGGDQWSQYQQTFTIGDVAPANDHNCVKFTMDLAAFARVTAIQFEPGPVATPFEHRPIGAELLLCQRYYQKVEFFRLYAIAESDSVRVFDSPRGVKMRADPTETATFSEGSNQQISGQAYRYKLTCQVSGAGKGSYISNYTADAEL